LIADTCSRFEAVWQTGQQPWIEDFLPAELPDKSGATLRNLLVRLVGIDLEWRWKRAGAPDLQGTVARQPAGVDAHAADPDVSESSLSLPCRPRLADYVARYPLLGPVEQLPSDLIADEYYARRRYGGRPTHAEYLAAFGAVHSDLAKQLQAIDDGMASDPNKAGGQPEEHGLTETAPLAETPPIKQPERIGRYRVERLLGQGGFGLVYLAYDDQLDRSVAIKVPHAHLIVRPGDAEAYLAEARTVANLDHPNIVPVYDVGGTGQFPCYVVSKFIDGTSLAARLAQSRLSPREAVELVATVAEALQHAHKQGLVHRDIKPGNILLDKAGKPFVMDFGLALRERDVGKEPCFAGTPAYMSPEQARGEGHRVDGRSDIFSLGIMFYELLTGRRPFQGDSSAEVLEKIATIEARPPRQWDDTIPKELERICLKSLSKRASERYTTSKDMADDLRYWLRCSSGERHSAEVRSGIGGQVLETELPATPNPGKDVFVSYAAADKEAAFRLCRELEDQGVGCWIAPRDVLPGADYDEAVLGAIEATQATLLLLSARANASMNVKREVQLATSQRKRLIPVRLEDVQPGPSLEKHLAAAQWLDAWRLPLDQFALQLAAVIRPAGSKPAAPSVPDTPAITPSSDQRPLKIVPKGLRSFDAHDADFFLELLPGPRDREGLPDSIRFWKNRIEERDADNTFSVGLIYGPSGCGKSSLVKAGLLPRLSNDVISVYVEATAEETETRLLSGLRKRCFDLPANLGLKETLAVLRRGQGIPPGKKVLIVLDQFEQWLHAKKNETNTELVEALRQCDGSRVQCIVMVRDDFWMAATRFMRSLEVHLLENQNSAAVDLFPIRHAAKVLAAFGRAFGVLPEQSVNATKEQKQFLEQAVSGLAEDGKVVCVRLALFAEMMKGKAWTPATLKEVGGTEGVGVTFLEETFSASTAPPDHRYHQKAARAVLKALLPDSGTDIKGHMRSYAELLAASGYADRPKDFGDLIGILDGEIRLITPTDPEGKEGAEDSASQAKTGDRYYQLTHDYLVPSLREWLTRKQRETRKGRAELRLAERSASWNAKPENRYLPSPWEWLDIRLFTRKGDWTGPQRTMMHSAARHHGLCWGTGLLLVITLGIGIQQYLAAKRRENEQYVAAKRLENDRRRAESLVGAVLTAPADAVPYAIQNLMPLREHAISILDRQYQDGRLPPSQRLHAALAMAAFGQVQQDFLAQAIATAETNECRNLITALRLGKEGAVKAVLQQGETAGRNKDWPQKARFAIVALHLGESALARDMLQVEQRPDPVQRTVFIKTFPTWHGDLSDLLPALETTDDSALRSGICCAMGGVSPDTLSPEEKKAWGSALQEWYRSKPDAGTHGAAGFALGQWKLALPSIAPTAGPQPGAHWFVNSVGMTMVLIPAGEFLMGSPGSDNNFDEKQHRVRITKPFWLGMHLVTVGQFRKFVEESKHDAGAEWQEAFHAQTENHPVVSVNWDDAKAFCDWLSKKEGKKYRLPTEAEWEYACRAGTRTTWSFGDNEGDLGDYAWFALNSLSQTHAVGQKRPNAYGLFDMHGNVWEQCQDWYDGGYYAKSPIDDPAGPTTGAIRVYRGGSWDYPAGICRSADRFGDDPGGRRNGLGFRASQVLADK
jgi:formylglycine-generating enzyme required for sulfatase activity/energy-coupling factor transporter ATP-binding protein EcfA2/predicted Ser/Thr protein kinase